MNLFYKKPSCFCSYVKFEVSYRAVRRPRERFTRTLFISEMRLYGFRGLFCFSEGAEVIQFECERLGCYIKPRTASSELVTKPFSFFQTAKYSNLHICLSSQNCNVAGLTVIYVLRLDLLSFFSLEEVNTVVRVDLP